MTEFIGSFFGSVAGVLVVVGIAFLADHLREKKKKKMSRS